MPSRLFRILDASAERIAAEKSTSDAKNDSCDVPDMSQQALEEKEHPPKNANASAEQSRVQKGDSARSGASASAAGSRLAANVTTAMAGPPPRFDITTCDR